LSDVFNVLILGGGPAGYTAALYAARANLSPVLLAGPQPGGQLTITTDVENYPGFRDGIQGPALMEIMREQAVRFGTTILHASADRVDFSKRPFIVHDDNDQTYRAKTIIVATGASARLLGFESETAYMGFGVSACATCDGFFFRGKRVIVIGGGDTAMEEATFLTKFAEVTVVHRRRELRASKIMQERAFKNPKIKFIWDSEVIEVIGDGKTVTGAKLRNVKTDEVTDLPIDGIFVAIGHQPNTRFLRGHLSMNANGYIQVSPGTSRTSIEGVFAAGDVHDPVYRQAVTAAGAGCMAAIDAERWLAAQEHVEAGASA
jgi:thioredoxin reductase (NADPH)